MPLLNKKKVIPCHAATKIGASNTKVKDTLRNYILFDPLKNDK